MSETDPWKVAKSTIRARIADYSVALLGHSSGSQQAKENAQTAIDVAIDAARAAEAAQHRQEIAAKDETIRQQAAQIEALKEIADEAFGVCICGCQLSEHENYGEDGEQCENEMHECIRTSKAAYAVVHTLRARLAAVEAERDKAIDENIRLTNAEIEALRAERDRLKAALANLIAPMCSRETDNGVVRHKTLVVAGDNAFDLYRAARAALTPQHQPSTDGETR